jgi:hypothetical protein
MGLAFTRRGRIPKLVQTGLVPLAILLTVVGGCFHASLPELLRKSGALMVVPAAILVLALALDEGPVARLLARPVLQRLGDARRHRHTHFCSRLREACARRVSVKTTPCFVVTSWSSAVSSSERTPCAERRGGLLAATAAASGAGLCRADVRLPG